MAILKLSIFFIYIYIWFLVEVQCLPKCTHSQWLADDGPKSPKQLSWPKNIYCTRNYCVKLCVCHQFLEVVIEVKLNLIILGVDSMQYLYLIVVAEKLVSSISAFLFVSGVISPTTFFLLMSLFHLPSWPFHSIFRATR